MAKETFGATVRRARESLGWDRPTLAKKVKISAGYVGHIERSAPVPVSDKLLSKLQRALHLKSNHIPKMVQAINLAAQRYNKKRYSKPRKKKAA